MHRLNAREDRKIAARIALAALLFAATVPTLTADTFSVTYDAAGVEAATATTICATASRCLLDEETFDEAWSQPTFNATWTSLAAINVTGDSIAGVYTGGTSLTRDAAGEYGGAGGTGYYPEVSNGSYTLTLTPSGSGVGVNYFGLWLSALDAQNTVQIYNAAGALLYTLTASSLTSALGACTAGAYCGNPLGAFKGQDNTEQFVFLNFYDLTGSFGKIVFSEASASGLETDNQTVGFISTITPTGTPLYTNMPEPDSFAILSLGAGAMIALRRLRVRRTGSPLRPISR